MSIVWAVSIAVVVLLLGYELQFTAATLAFGRWLSDADTGNGYQGAVTPPWEAKLGLVIYGLTLTLVGLSWYEFGIGRALLTVGLIFGGLLLAKRLFPGEDSQHFRLLIVRSMANRYADFVRSGDVVRADVMKMLLQKAGAYPEVPLGNANQ